MKKRSGIFLALAMGVVGTVGFASVDAVSMLKVSPTRVAVVDLSKVLSELEEGKKILADRRASDSKLRGTQMAMGEDLKDKQNSLNNVYKSGSPQYNKAFDEFLELQIRIKASGEIGQNMIIRNQVADMKVLYGKLVSEIEVLAKREGYDLVLQISNYDKIAAGTKAFNSMLVGRKALYTSDELDVTATIIAAMNAKFKSGQ